MILPESNQLANTHTHTHPNSRNLRHTHSIAIPQFISSFSKHASFFLSFQLSFPILNRSTSTNSARALSLVTHSSHIPSVLFTVDSLFLHYTHTITKTHTHIHTFTTPDFFC